MPFGIPARALTERSAASRLRPLLVASLLTFSLPALAADQPSSLKEVLGKAQSEAETKAVEDLVGKLKGGQRKTPAPTTATPPATTPPPATETAATPPTTAPAPPASSAGTPPSTPSAPPPEAPSVAAGTPSASETPPAASTVPPKEDRVASPSAPAAPPEASTPPEEAVKSAEQKQIPSVDIEVFFAYNSAEITLDAVAALTPLGRALSDVRLADDAFLIAGHTDAKGGASFNLDLSQRRAEAVRRFLVTNFGIDEKKLVAKGFGLKHLKNPKRPLASVNRRVQVVNLSKEERR